MRWYIIVTLYDLTGKAHTLRAWDLGAYLPEPAQWEAELPLCWEANGKETYEVRVQLSYA